MENKAHAIAAGIFTLVLGAAVVLAAMWLTGDTREKVYFVIESHYPVTGLSEAAWVRYRGVGIGQVRSIEFDPRDSRIILISISVDRSVTLTRGTYAELRYQGVTGLSYVMLDDTGTNPDPLPPAGQQGSERIVVRESAFANLAEVAQQVLGDAREMAKRVNTLLSDENQAQLAAALKNVELATRQVTQLAKSIEPVARGSTALVADVRKTFERADKLLNEISGTNRELASRLDAIDRMADSAQKAGGSVASLAEAVTEGTLPRINLLAEELSRTSRSLDRLAADLKQQPQSLVFGRRAGPPGPGEKGFEEGKAGAAAPRATSASSAPGEKGFEARKGAP
jgi:phospholipid/cholesterol/gamma-HCH transport system substrate-binding protein